MVAYIAFISGSILDLSVATSKHYIITDSVIQQRSEEYSTAMESDIGGNKMPTNFWGRQNACRPM